jgi:hypothetical protein
MDAAAATSSVTKNENENENKYKNYNIFLRDNDVSPHETRSWEQ